MTIALEVYQMLGFILLSVMYILELNKSSHLRKQNEVLKEHRFLLSQKIKKLRER